MPFNSKERIITQDVLHNTKKLRRINLMLENLKAYAQIISYSDFESEREIKIAKAYERTISTIENMNEKKGLGTPKEEAVFEPLGECNDINAID